MESPLTLEQKTHACEKIKRLIYDHCVLLQHDISSAPLREINLAPDEPVPTTIAISTIPKRKILFSNIEKKNVKQQKIDTYGLIKDEIIIVILMTMQRKQIDFI